MNEYDRANRAIEYYSQKFEITDWHADRNVSKHIVAKNDSGSRYEVFGMYAEVSEGTYQWVIAVLAPVRSAYTFYDRATVTPDYIAEKFQLSWENYGDIMGLAMTIARVVDGNVLWNGKEYK